MKPLFYKGFIIYRDKPGQNNNLYLPKYKDIEIYFGCKHIEGKTDFHQPKNIKQEWFISYYFLINGKYKRFKVKGGINRFHTVKSRFEEALTFVPYPI